jgi:TctA family transporter
VLITRPISFMLLVMASLLLLSIALPAIRSRREVIFREE